VPADEPLLEPHRRSDVSTLTFGPGGDVTMVGESADSVEIDCAGERLSLSVDFPQSHLRRDLLAAVAAAHAVGVRAGGRLHVTLSPGRGQRTRLPGDVTLIDDSYNANPVSMRAALDELAATAERIRRERCGSAAAGRERRDEPRPRRVAVLGDMLELGEGALGYHAEIGAHAAATADVLVTIGPLAASIADRFPGEHLHADDARDAAVLVSALVRDGDVVLVKASNGVGLQHICEALRAGAPA
jgi:UDP-N-acetylmuramoyl-tripeptide--D-alanyl-D-alanine ligase